MSPASAAGALEPVLELSGCDYDLSGVWRNRAAAWGPGRPLAAAVPASVDFDSEEQAFVFSRGGDIVTAPLAGAPLALGAASFVAWVKVLGEPTNLAWILCQGWSRAVALNDRRLGYVSLASCRHRDLKVGQPPIDEWIHVTGVWTTDGHGIAYMNGIRGLSTETCAGTSTEGLEDVFCIGGRAPLDADHNAAVKISDVSVFDRALSDAEVLLLYMGGRSQSKLGWDPSSPLAKSGSPVPVGFGLQKAELRLEGTTLSPERKSTEDAGWDEATGIWWCSAGVSAYDIPDGELWQKRFEEAVQASEEAVTRRVGLSRCSGDDPASDGGAPRPGRALVRCPSDPDKRAARAAHTEALMHMDTAAGLQVRVQGKELALFRFGGRVFAVDAKCPHQGANLCEGEVGDIEDMVLGKRYYVRCKVHKFQFDLVTGAVAEGRCPALRVYHTRIAGGAGAAAGLRHGASKGATAATVEVGFESLGAEYFGPAGATEADDF